MLAITAILDGDMAKKQKIVLRTILKARVAVLLSGLVEARIMMEWVSEISREFPPIWNEAIFAYPSLVVSPATSRPIDGKYLPPIMRISLMEWAGAKARLNQCLSLNLRAFKIWWF